MGWNNSYETALYIIHWQVVCLCSPISKGWNKKTGLNKEEGGPLPVKMLKKCLGGWIQQGGPLQVMNGVITPYELAKSKHYCSSRNRLWVWIQWWNFKGPVGKLDIVQMGHHTLIFWMEIRNSGKHLELPTHCHWNHSKARGKSYEITKGDKQ